MDAIFDSQVSVTTSVVAAANRIQGKPFVPVMKLCSLIF
jgi:hypothetical protein